VPWLIPTWGNESGLDSDPDTYKREEQRRFEVLDFVWNLQIKAVDRG
jgi:hypothetical protein